MNFKLPPKTRFQIVTLPTHTNRPNYWGTRRRNSPVILGSRQWSTNLSKQNRFNAASI